MSKCNSFANACVMDEQWEDQSATEAMLDLQAEAESNLEAIARGEWKEVCDEGY